MVALVKITIVIVSFPLFFLPKHSMLRIKDWDATGKLRKDKIISIQSPRDNDVNISTLYFCSMIFFDVKASD